MSEKAVSKREKIGFASVFAGLIFIFNPCINILDILPDVFGFLLIYAGLRKQAVADGYFEDARKISLYLVFLYAAKLVLSFDVLKDPNNSLSYTFIFSVLEIIFLLTFFHKLFYGFEYTLMRSSENLSGVRTNEAYAFSMIFVIVKCVGVVLVELFELITQGTDYDLSANAAYYASLAGAKVYAMLLCLLVQLILGVIFIYQMAKFFMSVKKHPSYYKELAEKYVTEISVNRTKHLNKMLSASAVLMIVAVVFNADIFFEGFDILPDVFTALFAVMSVVVLCRAEEALKIPRIATAVLMVSAVVQTVFSVYVNPERFYLLALQKPFWEKHSNGFYDSTNAVYITALVSALFAVSVIYFIICFIKRNRTIYEKNLLGNHDRKLLTVGVFVSLTAVFKGISATVQSVIANLSVNPFVKEFISDRPVLTEQRMNERINESAEVARYVSLENFAFVLSVIAILLVVFTVFNIFALSSEVTKDEN